MWCGVCRVLGVVWCLVCVACWLWFAVGDGGVTAVLLCECVCCCVLFCCCLVFVVVVCRRALFLFVVVDVGGAAVWCL